MKDSLVFTDNAGSLKRNLSFFMSEVASKNGKKTSVSFKIQVLFFAREENMLKHMCFAIVCGMVVSFYKAFLTGRFKNLQYLEHLQL